MNMVKIPPVLVKSLETSIGLYLNDYYMVYDAAAEDHDVKILQLKRAIRDYKMEEDDPIVRGLSEFRMAMLTKYDVRVGQEDVVSDQKALTKE